MRWDSIDCLKCSWSRKAVQQLPNSCCLWDVAGWCVQSTPWDLWPPHHLWCHWRHLLTTYSILSYVFCSIWDIFTFIDRPCRWCSSLQGNAGIGLAVLIVLLTVIVAFIAALSVIGICERCHIESGGVYFLLSKVLGARMGATLGILYSFGQVSDQTVHIWPVASDHACVCFKWSLPSCLLGVNFTWWWSINLLNQTHF